MTGEARQRRQLPPGCPGGTPATRPRHVHDTFTAWPQVRQLCKVFIGCRGAITRMHALDAAQEGARVAHARDMSETFPTGIPTTTAPTRGSHSCTATSRASPHRRGRGPRRPHTRPCEQATSCTSPRRRARGGGYTRGGREAAGGCRGSIPWTRRRGRRRSTPAWSCGRPCSAPARRSCFPRGGGTTPPPSPPQSR